MVNCGRQQVSSRREKEQNIQIRKLFFRILASLPKWPHYFLVHNTNLVSSYNYNQVGSTSALKMVTVFDGQLLRAWKYDFEGVSHSIHLYHDTITGVRSATLNHEEITDSLGTSNLFMEAAGHRILFNIKGTPGYIEIKRSGWVSFEYTCNIGGENILESTQQISAQQDEEMYKVTISGYTPCNDGQNEEAVIWYTVETERLTDGCRNVVHRRFKDFSSLNSEIKQSFKGHQLLSSLPNFVEKKSKWMVDHTDASFLEERVRRLEVSQVDDVLDIIYCLALLI
jgi:hypothetical protein